MITAKFSKKIPWFFSLGFGIEKRMVLDDSEKINVNDAFPWYHIKIYLGVYILLIDIHRKTGR